MTEKHVNELFRAFRDEVWLGVGFVEMSPCCGDRDGAGGSSATKIVDRISDVGGLRRVGIEELTGVVDAVWGWLDSGDLIAPDDGAEGGEEVSVL